MGLKVLGEIKQVVLMRFPDVNGSAYPKRGQDSVKPRPNIKTVLRLFLDHNFNIFQRSPRVLVLNLTVKCSKGNVNLVDFIQVCGIRIVHIIVYMAWTQTQ